MTRLYALDISGLLGDAWREYLPALPLERRERAMKMAQDADAARIVGAGLLLTHALDEAGVPPEERVFSKNAHGKPYLVGEDAPHFSLSHSGRWAVSAVSDAPVGVDVDSARCTMRIARRYFSAEEVRYLETLSEGAQKDALARLWTAKEAYLKATGDGLSAPLASFTVDLSAHSANIKNSPLRLSEYRLGEYYLCLCSAGGDAPPLIEYMQ